MASRRCFLPTTCLAFLLLPGVATAAEPAAALEFFEKDVRPLLIAKCFDCHGGKKSKGGLRLDARELILKGGDSGRRDPRQTGRKPARQGAALGRGGAPAAPGGACGAGDRHSDAL